jgi:hypothetical protein
MEKERCKEGWKKKRKNSMLNHGCLSWESLGHRTQDFPRTVFLINSTS